MHSLAFILIMYLGIGPNLGGVHSLANNAQSGSSEYRCWISSKTSKSVVSVLADFRNGSNKKVAVSYLFVSHRTGAAGSSVTTQRGQVKVESKSEAVLSTVKMNVGSHDSYFFKLSAFVNGRLVSQDSVEHYWKERQLQHSHE